MTGNRSDLGNEEEEGEKTLRIVFFLAGQTEMPFSAKQWKRSHSGE